MSTRSVIDVRAVAIFLCCFGATCWGQQAEVSIPCNEAEEPQELQYGIHSSGCEINPATDLDQFSFFGSQDESIRLIVSSLSGGFDPRIELRDPMGALVEDVSCNGRGDTGGSAIVCSVGIERTLLKSGIFFFAVSDLNTNEAGNYQMQLERLSPKAGIPDQLYNAVTVDLIDPVTDMDFLSFEGVQATTIRINGLSMSGGFDPRIEVEAPDGTVIADGNCNGRGDSGGSAIICSFNLEEILTQSGTHYLRISDFGSNEIGGYEIGLQCLFGACPLAADLGLTMADSADPVFAGSGLDYTMTVTNAGPGDAQNVIVTTLLPQETTFGFTTGCNQDPNGVPDCSLGEIPMGSSKQFSVSVTVDQGFEGTITTMASVDALTSEASSGDEIASENTEVITDDHIFGDGFEQVPQPRKAGIESI